MKRKPITILPLASALGALGAGAFTATEAESAVPASAPSIEAESKTGQSLVPNTLVSTGEALLGFVITKQPDGTIIAQHASHASHASHHSHYSGR